MFCPGSQQIKATKQNGYEIHCVWNECFKKSKWKSEMFPLRKIFLRLFKGWTPLVQQSNV